MASTTTYNDGLYTPWTSSSVENTGAVAPSSSYVAPATSQAYTSTPAAVASTSAYVAPSSTTPSSSYVAQGSSTSAAIIASIASTSAAATTSTSAISRSSASSMSTSTLKSSSSLPLLTASDDTSATFTNSALSSSKNSNNKSSFHAAYLAPLFVVIGLGIAYFVGRTLWRRKQNKREWWPNEHMGGDNEQYIYGDGMSEKEPYDGHARYNHQGWAQYDAPNGQDMLERGYAGTQQGGHGEEVDNLGYYGQEQGQDHGGWQENSYDYANVGYAAGGAASSPFWTQPEFPPGAVLNTSREPDHGHTQPRQEQAAYLGGLGASDYARIIDRDLPPPPSDSGSSSSGRIRSVRKPRSHDHESVPSEEPDDDYNVPPYVQDEGSDYTAYDTKLVQRSDEASYDRRSREGAVPPSKEQRPPVQAKSTLRNKASASEVSRRSPKKELLPAAFDRSPAVSDANEPGNSAASFILGYASEMTPSLSQEYQKDYLAHGPRRVGLTSPIPDAQRGTTLQLSNPDDPSPSDEISEDMLGMTTAPSGRIGRPDGFGGMTYDAPQDNEVQVFPQPRNDQASTMRKVTPTAQVVRSKRSFASPVLDKYAFHVNSSQKKVSDSRPERDLSFRDITADIDETLRDVNTNDARETIRKQRQQQQSRQPALTAEADLARRQTWREDNGRWTRLAESQDKPKRATMMQQTATVISSPQRARLQSTEPARSPLERGARSEVGTASTPTKTGMTATVLTQDHCRSVLGHSSPSSAGAAARQRSLHATHASHISDIPDEDLQMLGAASPTKRTTYYGTQLTSPVRAMTPSGPRSLNRAGGAAVASNAASNISPLRVGSQRSATSSVYSQ